MNRNVKNKVELTIINRVNIKSLTLCTGVGIQTDPDLYLLEIRRLKPQCYSVRRRKYCALLPSSRTLNTIKVHCIFSSLFHLWTEVHKGHVSTIVP